MYSVTKTSSLFEFTYGYNMNKYGTDTGMSKKRYTLFVLRTDALDPMNIRQCAKPSEKHILSLIYSGSFLRNFFERFFDNAKSRQLGDLLPKRECPILIRRSSFLSSRAVHGICHALDKCVIRERQRRTGGWVKGKERPCTRLLLLSELHKRLRRKRWEARSRGVCSRCLNGWESWLNDGCLDVRSRSSPK